jgi:hypothetical protein
MRTIRLMTGLAVLACAVAGVSAQSAPLDAAAAFERMKALQGTWEATAANGKKATTTFELTAGGTVLLERYENPAMPGGGQMATAYFVEGKSLVLTHYCIARNQPTLRAETYDPAAGQIQFEFLRASNLAGEGAGHRRRAMYRVDGPDRFTTAWEYFDKGVLAFTETETFTRVRKGA